MLVGRRNTNIYTIGRCILYKAFSSYELEKIIVNYYQSSQYQGYDLKKYLLTGMNELYKLSTYNYQKEMGLWKNERIIDLLWRVVFIAPMLKWLLDTIKKLNKDISTLQELDSDINNNETKTMEDLQDIQKVIFQHRKGCYAIPECIYNIFKDNDEDRAYREARM